MKLRNFTDINQYLGSSSTRFFGEGYKKVKYKINNKTLSADAVIANISIEYPHDWSIKNKKKKLEPHLSSIDVLLIATNMSGFLLSNLLGNLNGCYINSITVAAGRSPLLELNNVSVNLRLVSKTKIKDVDLFNFKGNVGAMKVNLAIAYDKLKLNEVADCLLASDYIRESFAKVNHQIKNILIENDCYASADFIKNGSMQSSVEPDVIDAFVSALQLGQVLLYELDNITRSTSKNLWMRRIKVTQKEVEPQHSSENIVTKLDDLQLSKINNVNWRSANIISKLHGIEIACSVAHQLPQSSQSHMGETSNGY